MKRLIFVAAFLFTGMYRLVCAQEGASRDSTLKHRDNAALATEKTPVDNWSLAVYFRELASQERALADSYEQMASIYKNTKPPAGLDPASARKIENQYKRLAETGARAAAAAANVAAYHRYMADMTGAASLVATRGKTDGSAFRK